MTFDVAKAVQEVKAGKVEYRVEKAGIVHVPIGKASFGPEKLTENAAALVAALVRAKPAAAKGNYLAQHVRRDNDGSWRHDRSERRAGRYGRCLIEEISVKREEKTALIAEPHRAPVGRQLGRRDGVSRPDRGAAEQASPRAAGRPAPRIASARTR